MIKQPLKKKIYKLKVAYQERAKENVKLKAENERLKELLEQASCPSKSCEMGSVYVLDQSQNTVDVEECLWCSRVKQALKGGE